LDYEFPAGQWTILRFGHTTNGNLIHPASKRTEGLEVDKFNKEALYHHLDSGVTKNTLERMGKLTGRTVVEMNIDSWEANCQTWTAKFPEEFEARRGYDMTKWLITLTGRFVGDLDQTERFLWDYRRTIGDLPKIFTVLSPTTYMNGASSFLLKHRALVFRFSVIKFRSKAKWTYRRASSG
jgi:phosphatidate phosphatase PAH1